MKQACVLLHGSGMATLHAPVVRDGKRRRLPDLWLKGLHLLCGSNTSIGRASSSATGPAALKFR